MKAKHCVRFILANNNVFGDENLLSDQINHVIANFNEDDSLCILYELIKAEEKYINEHGVSQA